ncbi:MAG: DUF5056 domain-containing protein [Paludibacter sp.]|nr:DUF5056 domain-containing protein [Paludibacter sp.]
MKQKNENNDLNVLFKINKMEILDEGFSQKVSQKIPSTNNSYTTTYIIWTIALIILVGVVFKFFNFTENFPLLLSRISENFIAALILFFKNPNIYITTFLALLTAGGFWAFKKTTF